MDADMTKNFLSDIPASRKKTLFYKDVTIGSRQLRVVAIPFYYTFNKKKLVYLIHVGVSRKPAFEILYGRLIFAAVTIPLILLLAGFFGGVITDRVLKPIMLITAVAFFSTGSISSVDSRITSISPTLKF